MVRGLKIWIQKVEGLYYPCSESKGADQLRCNHKADLRLCFRIHNQRTNGPVNAHLISGPTVSTKTNKIGQGQPRVIIYINFVELESPMLHAKFQDLVLEKIFKGFYHIWA